MTIEKTVLMKPKFTDTELNTLREAHNILSDLYTEMYNNELHAILCKDEYAHDITELDSVLDALDDFCEITEIYS